MKYVFYDPLTICNITYNMEEKKLRVQPKIKNQSFPAQDSSLAFKNDTFSAHTNKIDNRAIPQAAPICRKKLKTYSPDVDSIEIVDIFISVFFIAIPIAYITLTVASMAGSLSCFLPGPIMH